MSALRVYSAAEQVANHLREELAKGVWTGKMPGGAALSRELGAANHASIGGFQQDHH